MADSPMLKAALAYAERGLPVFPCRPDKRPYTKRGFKDATTDPAIIRDYWTRWPEAPIGVPMGKASGMVAIDADQREAYDGLETLVQLEEQLGPLPATRLNLTPKGHHYIFHYPQGVLRIPCSAGKLGPGVDVRGDGGYIIVPPSRLPDGGRYDWEASHDTIAELPSAWLDAMGAVYEHGRAPTHDELPRVQRGGNGSHEPPYTNVEQVAEGQRNTHLARVMGAMVHQHSYEEAKQLVRDENIRVCEPPLTEQELVNTVFKSGLKWREKVEEQQPDEEPQFDPTDHPFIRASDMVRDLALPDFLVHNMIERGSLNLWHGPYGAGKSYMLLDLNVRRSGGMDVHGRSTKPGLSVFCAGEGQGGIARRLRAWEVMHGEPIPDNFFVLPMAVPIGDPQFNGWFLAKLTALQQETGEAVSMVTLDTLSRYFGGQDENSNSDMMRFVYRLQTEIQLPFNCAVNLPHHPAKHDDTQGRGAGALPAACETEWQITRMERDSTVFVKVSCRKAKDFETPHPMYYKLERVSFEIDGYEHHNVAPTPCEPVEAEPDTPLTGKASKAFDTLVELLDKARRNLEAQGREPSRAKVDTGSWREVCAKRAVFSDRKAWYRITQTLKNTGWVHVDEFDNCWPKDVN